MKIPALAIVSTIPILLTISGGCASPAVPALAPSPSHAPEVGAPFHFAAADDAPEPPPPIVPVAVHEPEPNAALLESCDAARSIVIHKAARRLELYCGDDLAARFDTSLGFAPAGAKQVSGDGKTPEGEYYVTLKYESKFHRSLQLSYPGIADADRGLREHVVTPQQHDAIVRAVRACQNPPQDTALGSYVQIHGGGGGSEAGDWTLGCVAVDDPEIEQVYAFHRAGCTPDGTPRTKIVILP